MVDFDTALSTEGLPANSQTIDSISYKLGVCNPNAYICTFSILYGELLVIGSLFSLCAFT